MLINNRMSLFVGFFLIVSLCNCLLSKQIYADVNTGYSNLYLDKVSTVYSSIHRQKSIINDKHSKKKAKDKQLNIDASPPIFETKKIDTFSAKTVTKNHSNDNVKHIKNHYNINDKAHHHAAHNYHAFAHNHQDNNFNKFNNNYGVGYGYTLTRFINNNDGYFYGGKQSIYMNIERSKSWIWFAINLHIAFSYTQFNASIPGSSIDPVGQDPFLGGVLFKIGYNHMYHYNSLYNTQIIPYIIFGKLTNFSASSKEAGAEVDPETGEKIFAKTLNSYFISSGIGAKIAKTYRNAQLMLFVDPYILYNKDLAKLADNNPSADHMLFNLGTGVNFAINNYTQIGFEPFVSYYLPMRKLKNETYYNEYAFGSVLTLRLNY